MKSISKKLIMLAVIPTLLQFGVLLSVRQTFENQLSLSDKLFASNMAAYSLGEYSRTVLQAIYYLGLYVGSGSQIALQKYQDLMTESASSKKALQTVRLKDVSFDPLLTQIAALEKHMSAAFKLAETVPGGEINYKEYKTKLSNIGLDVFKSINQLSMMLTRPAQEIKDEITVARDALRFGICMSLLINCGASLAALITFRKLVWIRLARLAQLSQLIPAAQADTIAKWQLSSPIKQDRNGDEVDRIGTQLVDLGIAEVSSRLRLQKLIAETSDAVAIVSVNGQFVLSNRRFDAIFDIKQPPTSTQTTAILKGENWKPFFDGLARVIKTKSGTTLDMVFAADDLHKSFICTLSAPTDAGEIFAVLHDVTEVRAAEVLKSKTLNYYSGVLASQVEVLSHDLQVVLAKIKDGAMPEVIAAEANLNRVIAMLNDLGELQITSTTSANDDPKKSAVEPIDLMSILSKCLSTMKPLGKPKALRFELQGPPAVVIQGTKSAIESLIQNLLSNAMKFSPHGGTVLIEVQAEDDVVLLIIEDDGPGINQSDIQSIFEPYKQSDAGKVIEHSSGLGLAICWSIVKGHGGTITAQNKAKGGARFIARLPLLHVVIDPAIVTMTL